MQVNERIFRLTSAWVGGLFAAIITTRLILADQWSADSRISHPGYADFFFSAQALSILQGRWDVAPADIPGECYYVDDQCIGYYGITPSILRLPFLMRLPLTAPPMEHGLSALMTIAALALGILASILVVDQVWRMATKTKEHVRVPVTRMLPYLVAIIVVAPGTLLIQIARPAVYEEAIAWATTFSLLGIWLFLKWIETRRTLLFVPATLAFILATNSRPTGATIALGLGGLVLLLIATKQVPANRKTITAGVLLALLPALSTFAVFQMKFNTPVPSLTLNEQIPESAHWAAIFEANGGHGFSPTFVPTTAWSYLRPDSLGLRPDTPTFTGSLQLVTLTPEYREPTWIWPLNPGGLYYEPVASITALAPVGLALTIVAAIWPARLRQRLAQTSTPDTPLPAWVSRVLLAAAALGGVLALTTAAVTSRYLGDFVPLIALGAALAAPTLEQLAQRRPKTTFGINTALIAFGMLGSVVSITVLSTQTLL